MSINLKIILMTRKIIGLYQLITGIFGIILILFNAMDKSGSIVNSQQAIIVLVIGLLFFGLLTWSGYGLMYNLRNAIKYSMFLQAVQIPWVAINGLVFNLSAAGFVSVGWHKGKGAVELSLQPIHFDLSSNALEQENFMFYIVPAILLYALVKLK